ncbi:glucosamine-6-phosphate deaminase [Shouchella clausii]|uniref:glucosamine-6-phosphate deaminase n=1 Tax=Shouchella clausii TaxID=79880 RepID=UPI002147A8BF|nr:glucosamine-6-phosphate deaminase [Shouchella clausii]MCR1289040.1 glucosamine-6-phosphate deaminase [Shouchella clausii]
MNIIHVKNYEEMSQKAAALLFERIQQSPKITLGLATGGTPENTYTALIAKAKENGQSFSHVQTFNLDEYVGLPAEDKNSYRHYMKQRLFDHVDIPKEKTHLPNGMAPSLEEECRAYENMIAEAGGIDIQLLGIGSNGHIGFNEPGTPFSSKTHVVELAEETRKANARYFPTLEDVPKQAITMGIQTIMEAKEILLLISGKAKAEAFAKLCSDEVTEAFPASILNKHPNVTVIADEEAASAYTQKAHL